MRLLQNTVARLAILSFAPVFAFTLSSVVQSAIYTDSRFIDLMGLFVACGLQFSICLTKRAYRTRSAWPHSLGLTPREIEVADLLAAGWSNARIAEHLFISLPTVKSHVRSVMQKAEVRSRRELVPILVPSLARISPKDDADHD